MHASAAPCFLDDADYAFYLRCLQEATARHRCSVHAYALTPRVAQFSITPLSPGAEHACMRAATSRYAIYRLRHLGPEDAHDVPRWSAVPVEADSHLFVSQMYIELLPVRLGLVDRPDAYRWSSHGGNIGGYTDRCIIPHRHYRFLGATPEERAETYRALFSLSLDPGFWARIEAAIAAGRPLGGPDFVRRFEPPDAVCEPRSFQGVQFA